MAHAHADRHCYTQARHRQGSSAPVAVSAQLFIVIRSPTPNLASDRSCTGEISAHRYLGYGRKRTDTLKLSACTELAVTVVSPANHVAATLEGACRSQTRAAAFDIENGNTLRDDLRAHPPRL